MYNSDPDKIKYEYDVITGVSIGAINTGFMSLYAKGDEANMIADLSEEWHELTTRNIYKRWFPLSLITGIRKHSGVFNDAPGIDFFNEKIKEHGWKI